MTAADNNFPYSMEGIYNIDGVKPFQMEGAVMWYMFEDGTRNNYAKFQILARGASMFLFVTILFL